MMIIFRIAWLNVWRQTVRSLVVIMAISLGLWAGLLVTAFVKGMMGEKISNVVSLELSHVQIHRPGFMEENLPHLTIDQAPEILGKLSENEDVRAWCSRVKTHAMVASSNHSGGAMIIGIEPEAEKQVTELYSYLEEGNFLDSNDRIPILISRKLAEKYKVSNRSKLVLTFQDADRNLTSAAFRVSGIFDTGNNLYDESRLFVRITDLQKHLGISGGIHEIAIMAKEHEKAESLASALAKSFPGQEIKAWMDLSAGMRLMISAMDTYMYLIVGIILLALLFSIVNTMLMAVLERVKEIGMLMAVGMTRGRIFAMIMFETIFLTLTGGPLGLLLAWATISWFNTHGLDVGQAAYGDFGFSNIVYPTLEAQSYVEVTFMVLGMSVLAAVYPALKALKLKPVEAIRKI